MSSNATVVWNGDQVAPLFGYLGAAAALVFSCECAARGAPASRPVVRRPSLKPPLGGSRANAPSSTLMHF